MSRKETEDATLGFDFMRMKGSVLRRSVTKNVNKIIEWKDTKQVVEVIDLKIFDIQLKTQRHQLRELDSKILEFLLYDDADEETYDKEVDESNEFQEKSTKAVLYLEQRLKEGEHGSGVASVRLTSPSQRSISRNESDKKVKDKENGEEVASNSSASSSHRRITRSNSKESLVSICSGDYGVSKDSPKRRVRVKLPELQIERFSGKVYDFQAFWDSFSSAIHCIENLADVDKLQYLKAFLDEGQQ